MVARRPLVNISGQTTELPPGDVVAGGSAGTLTAGSGLNGGGDLATSVTTNVSLAPNPSGLIFVDGKLGVDGAVGVTANAALASGNFALVTGTQALASGTAGSALSTTALASGNAALAAIAAIPGGRIETFTAASAIASGYPVGLDDLGRVQSVREFVNADTRVFGAPVVFESASTSVISTSYDSTNNRVVISYRDVGNFSYGTSIVGIVSGTSISFGTAVVFNSGATVNISSAYDSTNNRIVVAYRDLSNLSYGTARVGTVSGTSISFGTAVVFRSSDVSSTSTIYDLFNNRVVISYRDDSNGFGTSIVGAVSGTSISFGTAVAFRSGTTELVNSVFDSTNNKVVVAYQGASSFGTAIIGTVSGTSISFGTPVVFQSSVTNNISCTYNSISNRVVISYSNQGNLNYGTAIVGTVSGTSISFGTAVVFESATTASTSCVYDSGSNRVIISYQDGDNSAFGTSIVGTVSGTSISFGTAVVFESANTDNISSTYDSTNKSVVISYRDVGNSNFGTSIVNSPTSSIFPTISSRNNFIGIAQSTVASGTSVRVRLPGSYDQNNTGLTPGAVYYLNPTISGFTTTSTQPTAWSGAVNWGPIGQAVNSTTLLLNDMV